jgi:hypothetical protein
MTHLIYATAFFALFCIGPVVVVPRTPPNLWRDIVCICSFACLTLSWIAFSLFLWPIFTGIR